MRAIVVGLGSAGDVHPNVGLALALHRRGFDVLFVSTEVFRPLAERTGLAFMGVGSEKDYDAAIRDPDLWHPTRSFPVVVKRLILPALRSVYDIIATTCGPGQTVVAAPGFAFGARIAHEKLGVPLVSIHLQPIMLRSAIEPGCFGFPDVLRLLPRALRPLYFRAIDKLVFERLLYKQINAFRAELGLDPVDRVFDRWVHSPQLVIGLFPEWYAPRQEDWPPHVELTGFPLWDQGDVTAVRAEVEEFLSQGDPPIVYTAGSAMLHAKQFFETSISLCRDTGRRGILLTRYPEQLPQDLPRGVRHFTYIPFSAVLPRSAALVHHGGIGTAAQAIAAGIPQLIVPYSHDQPDNAVRIRRLQLGDFLLPKHYTTANAIAALKRLCSPAILQNCERTAAHLDRSSLETAAILIEKLAANDGKQQTSAATT